MGLRHILPVQRIRMRSNMSGNLVDRRAGRNCRNFVGFVEFTIDARQATEACLARPRTGSGRSDSFSVYGPSPGRGEPPGLSKRLDDPPRQSAPVFLRPGVPRPVHRPAERRCEAVKGGIGATRRIARFAAKPLWEIDGGLRAATAVTLSASRAEKKEGPKPLFREGLGLSP